jgi:SAM-dependent methyltransferase
MQRDSLLEETARSYDRIVDGYEQQARRTAVQRDSFRDRFTELLTAPRAAVLDAGCGPGLDAEHFRAQGLLPVGVDISFGMARRAHERCLPVAVADLRQLPLRAASFDGIWCSASLLHVPREQAPFVLSGFRHLLRPRGVLGLVTSLGADEGWEAVPYEKDGQHRDVPLRRWFVHHERGELESLVRTSGLRLEHSEVRLGHRHWLQMLARRTE